MRGRISLSVSILLVPVLCTAAGDMDDAPSATASMHIERGSSSVRLQGHVSSTAHEVILRQTLREYLPELRADVILEIRESLPVGWSLVTDLTLRAIADTESAVAHIRTDELLIRGVSSDGQKASASVERIRPALLPGMVLVSDIVVVSPSLSFDDMCRTRFDRAIEGRRIDFPGAGDELSPGAQPLLDALVEIAADCPHARLRVTGHTDASGDENANVALSLARAEAVVAYMLDRGLPPDKLETVGAGSMEPLLDASDARARRINRRVEFELLLP